MADIDDDKSSNRRLASADRETRERVARMGGEASHRNDDRGSSGGRSGSSGGRD